MKPFDEEIVSGSILRSVWKLAWPVTLLNLVNGMHGFVDNALVGHYLSSPDNAANASIGVAWSVFLVIVVFIASLFHGMNVLISRYAGRQDRENLSRAAYQSFLCSVFILAILAPVGYVIAPYLLDFVASEARVKAYALPYLRIMFTCGAPLFLMFMFTGAFQASGDPKIPLVLGIMTTVLNIVVSTVLIVGLGPLPALGTVGAAVGTVVAPVPSVIIAIVLILRGKTIIQGPAHYSFRPDFRVLKTITRIGLPTGIQGVLLNLGGIFLLRYIGQLEHSAAAQAAYTICYAQLFSLVTWTCFGLRSAAATLMGQNIGAGKPARGKQAVAVASVFGAVWAMFWGLFYWFAPGLLLGIFEAVDEPVFSYGKSLLQYLTFSGIVLAITLALTGGLQGAGETKIPMYIAFLTQILVLLGICEYLKMSGMLTPDRVWMAIFISHLSRLVLTYAVFRTERWTEKRIELSEEAVEAG
ncbi:MAG: MATE family efflux transporter [Candidatus Hydrogenedentes bacterium]|nr:MATE family efflux transporter [Candidatus Hydrogenedentota bacterium]